MASQPLGRKCGTCRLAIIRVEALRRDDPRTSPTGWVHRRLVAPRAALPAADLTIARTAKFLNISERQAHVLLASGDLHVSRDSLAAFVKRRAVPITDHYADPARPQGADP